ncbi:Ankyrin repeat-containing protein [Nitrosomonas cryotolerans]|uniref:Ankyrin repeat-containing protein n=2 Tax=Nitrosomonas cryotolerans TaxID=44575 RepID=A0A1N6FZK3_9PROT|nr:ankyrin repeat domain-containing protein [Nitrosomonas cryotolerans]SFQ13214.1 Ankyrin repeat-containing protein [Nitrosomonas cryotolerans]SIO00739.1 Ankyrin repeat-containing protein [Nitrosomonas cryotolerans ATCC 49181]
MSKLENMIEEVYKQAKNGQWDQVLSDWKDIPLIEKRCSRYQKESSGWTFFHQAAYFGHETACRELIRLGASVNRRSREGKTAIDVAEERGYIDLANLLKRAFEKEGSLWVTPADPDLRPSSNRWDEANERRATEGMLVAYGGGVVRILTGKRYFVDSFERVLIETFAKPQ